MTSHIDSEPQLLRLAPELVENVIKQISDRKDLSEIRLTCKALDKIAANELFKDVFISPLEGHVTSWNSISQDNFVRHIPRHAIIHTQPDIEDHGGGMYRERYEVDEDDEEHPSFENAIRALWKFPNLTSLEIGFTPECLGREDGGWQDIPEDYTQREEVLQHIFQATKDRAADKRNKTIRKLTIVNLQNYPLPEFTSSDLFLDVMTQLDELHISVTQEYNEHGPDHDYTKEELQIFPDYFCSNWLKPVSARLKSLSIYHEFDNWGPFPGYFDPTGIAFPKLETLALGYYTPAHDNDFDWVFSIKSLRKLVLHNCMIASWIRIDKENMIQWGTHTHDWTKMSDTAPESWADSFAYEGKWSQYFDPIAEELPQLVDFRFGYGGGRYQEALYDVRHRDHCEIEVSARRYVCFDNGILPTHWNEADRDDGILHSWLGDGFPVNKHKENFEGDQRSLNSLLAALNLRR